MRGRRIVRILRFMSEQEKAFLQALEAFPGSIRALAREVGFSEGYLRAIRDGRRRATPKFLKGMAEALETLADRQAEAAHSLRQALRRRERPERAPVAPIGVATAAGWIAAPEGSEVEELPEETPREPHQPPHQGIWQRVAREDWWGRIKNLAEWTVS